MPAGALNRLITLERQGGVLNELNQPTQDWAQWGKTRWANYKAQTGMGVIKGGSEGASVPINACSWRIRYTPDIPDTGMRVTYGTKHYDIISIRHDEELQDYTDLICQLGGNDG
jgi:SPP1 family predicted phage head-tail adaptor